MPVATDPRIGSELLGYRVEALLGQGGMGVVYRAYDRRLKRRVALKLLAPELAENERFRERFLRESELAASLDHPGIVPIFEAGEVDGQLYIAMRYVDGSDLTALLRERGARSSPRRRWRSPRSSPTHWTPHTSEVWCTATSSLRTCSSTSAGTVTSPTSASRSGSRRTTTSPVDARSARSTTPRPSRSAARRSRRARMSTRSAASSSSASPATRRTGGLGLAVLFAHLEEPPASAAERRPELPVAIDAVFTRALAKEPAGRFPTCGELVTAAREALAVPEIQRRRLGLLAALGAALIVAAGLLAFMLLDGSGSAPAAGGALSASTRAPTRQGRRFASATGRRPSRPRTVASGSRPLAAARCGASTPVPSQRPRFPPTALRRMSPSTAGRSTSPPMARRTSRAT